MKFNTGHTTIEVKRLRRARRASEAKMAPAVTDKRNQKVLDNLQRALASLAAARKGITEYRYSHGDIDEVVAEASSLVRLIDGAQSQIDRATERLSILAATL